MEISSNISLKNKNTFGIDVNTSKYCRVAALQDVRELVASGELEKVSYFILGGGSNVLFTKDFSGLVIHNEIKGKKVLEKNKKEVFVEFGGGEIWDECVAWAVDQGFGGIENFSGIPGTVGAAPIQNIGAYGVELKDVFKSLEAVNLESGEVEVFDLTSCEFGYRDSFFKQDRKQKYFVTSIKLRLLLKPEINVAYKGIQDELGKRGIDNPTIRNVREVILYVRNTKLPNPKEIGNAGSFFKNPTISERKYKVLQKDYPDIPGHLGEGEVKLFAAWLIDQVDGKKIQKGDAGVYENHALILVNRGDASGKDVREVAEEIKKLVLGKFDIELEEEPTIL